MRFQLHKGFFGDIALGLLICGGLVFLKEVAHPLVIGS
jgi:hypothetical protein